MQKVRPPFGPNKGGLSKTEGAWTISGTDFVPLAASDIRGKASKQAGSPDWKIKYTLAQRHHAAVAAPQTNIKHANNVT